MMRQRLYLGFLDIFEQIFHVSAIEWRFKRCHFVNDAAKRPNVTFRIVRLIPPNFRACVVRRSSLCVGQLVAINFRYVQIAEFVDALAFENVSALNVAMEYASEMQILQAFQNVLRGFPDFLFFDQFESFCMGFN
jgi:hypothetical protein